MRNSDTSMLSIGATGAGATVAGSSARVHAPTAPTRSARRTALARRICGDGGGAFHRLVTDEQGQIGGECNALGLRMPLLVELAATEHLAPAVDLRVRPLRTRDEEEGAGAGVPG